MNKKELSSLTLIELEKRFHRNKNSDDVFEILILLYNFYLKYDLAKTLEVSNYYLEVANKRNKKVSIAKGNSLLGTVYIMSPSLDTLKGIEYSSLALKLSEEASDFNLTTSIFRNLGNAYMKIGDMKKAKSNLLKGLEIAETQDDTIEIMRLQHALSMYYGRKGDFQKMHLISNELYEKGIKENDLFFQSVALGNIISSELHLGNIIKCIQLIEKNISLKKILNEPEGVIYAKLSLADIQLELGNYELSLNIIEECKLLIMPSYPRYLDLMRRSHSLLIACYFNLGKFKEVLEESYITLDLAKNMNDKYYIISELSSIGFIEVEKFNDENGLKKIEESIGLSIEIESSEALANCYVKYSQAFKSIGKKNDALSYCNKAIQILESENLSISLANSLIMKGELLISLGNLNTALKITNEAIEIVKSKSINSLLHICYEQLSQIYEFKKDFKKAFNFHKLFHQTKDEILNLNVSQRVQAVFVQLDTERAMQQAENNRVKADQLYNELEMKKKELSMLALQLVNKNEFLNDIKIQISDDISETNEFIKNIAKHINSNVESDKDWLEFEKRFVVLNPSFSSKLLEKSLNKLTITEIKICSLIKTGLNTQEVANVLFLSKRTVENHRYHIQKKLDLVDLKLEAFLITL